MSHQIENHVVGCGLFFAISDYRDPAVTDRAAMRRAYALLPAERVSPRVRGGAPSCSPTRMTCSSARPSC